MHLLQKTKLSLTLASLCILGAMTMRPADAQNLVYTLTGVTFSDGATGSGSFSFNPTAASPSANLTTFNIATTAGVTDALTAGSYVPGTANALERQTVYFDFNYGGGTASFHDLLLMTATAAASPGTYPLLLGKQTAPNQFTGSGEYAPTSRLLTSGSLVVTNAVPEASTTVSFGLLLALGLGGAALAVRKKRRFARKNQP